MEFDVGFREYQHVEKFGTTVVQNINIGTCYVFPKIDGTNGSVWFDKTMDKISAGSRNRELSFVSDNKGFYQSMVTNPYINLFFKEYKDRYTLYGEWLVPHTITTYKEDAWKHFYIFDVFDNAMDKYVDYDTYLPLLETYRLNYIPAMCKINNPSYDRLINMLEQNYFLLPDGAEPGEGIVIKNYDFKNKFGRTQWAKIVRNDFKTKHSKIELKELCEGDIIEEQIVNKYVTQSLVNKEYAKIINDTDGWESKLIPRLLHTVFYCLVTEESWNYVKEFKNPCIDYKRLQAFTIQKIKKLLPNLF